MSAAFSRPSLGWAVLATVFHTMALFTTIFRLVHRLRTSRMWWDDYMVILPFALDAAYFAGVWILYKFQLDHGDENAPSTGISSYWISAFILLSVNWLCRISTAITFARLFPAFHRARRIALFLATAFCPAYLCCIFVLTFLCPPEPQKSIDPNCQKGPRNVLAKGLIPSFLHILGDISLISFPIITLWKVKLPQNLRSIIIWAFSGSALTLISVIVFVIVRYDKNLQFDPSHETMESLVNHITATVSLMVSNLLVIVSFFYRIFRRIHDIESRGPPITTKAPSEVTEDQGFARETFIGQVSALDTGDRPLSFTSTRTQFTELVWTSIRVSEPPSLLTQDISSRS